MTAFAELQVDVAGLIGHHVHRHLAKAGDGVLPERFFNHADGRPVDRVPLVRMSGNGKRIRIIGVTDEGLRLVCDHAADVVRMLDPLARWKLRTGMLRSQPSAERAYEVHSCVVNVPRELEDRVRAGRAVAFEDPELRAVLADRIVGSLRAQHAAFDLGQVAVTVTHLRPVRSVAVEVRAGRYFSAVDAVFALDRHLIGPWQVGSLLMRGYGRLSEVR